jgi:dihydrofolate reductase/thymidylate synthase
MLVPRLKNAVRFGWNSQRFSTIPPIKKFEFATIVAQTLRGGIGKNNTLPWKLGPDLKLFAKHTTNNVIIMGRKTYESLPRRPLPNRIHIVISNTLKNIGFGVSDPNVIVVPDFHQALTVAKLYFEKENKKIYIIGGARLYDFALDHPNCKQLFVTQILNDIECDTHISNIPNDYKLIKIGQVEKQDEIYYQFLEYARKHEEYQYLDFVNKVIQTGNDKPDRTNTGTLSKFGQMMRYNLRDGQIPLLTTKDVFWRGTVEELCWLIRGSTDAKQLHARKVYIWDKDGAPTNGDLGPIYGHQWRFCGAKYTNCDDNYKGQGIDQLRNVVESIKKDPHSRRHIVNSWNVSMLDQMMLHPCHAMFQYYVSNRELSCVMYQRSCDLGLGYAWNIASYSLLTHIIAKICNLNPGEFIHVLGDSHVYKTHVTSLQEQMNRTPHIDFPIVELHPDLNDIDKVCPEYIKLHGYKPQSKIKMEMAYREPDKK